MLFFLFFLFLDMMWEGNLSSIEDVVKHISLESLSAKSSSITSFPLSRDSVAREALEYPSQFQRGSVSFLF